MSNLVDFAGSHIRAAELFWDGPIPAVQLEHAQAQDRAAAAAREADPLLDAQDRLREAELDRDVALLALRPILPFLAQHAGEPDDAYVGRDHADGCCWQHMGDHRAEAAGLRTRVIAAVVQIACLNMAVGRLVREAA